MKVLTVVGTRPELIRLSRIIARLEAETDHRLVNTGQNWDPMLSDVFFAELGIRQPDHWLGVPVTSLGAVIGGVITAIEPILRDEQPDALLVLGDTNSGLSSIIAKRFGVPVFHMEAGNRSFDENVPEETNRRIIDHTADFNLCYTEHARRNLLAEGLPARRIFVTGSPMGEVLAAYHDRIEASTVLDRLGLEPGSYFLVSMHREENIDSPARLGELIGALDALAAELGKRIVVSAHPRLRNRMAGSGHESGSALEFREPFGFFDYNKLQRNARCVLSDSGTISEESAISNFPAVTIRDSMERPEALDTGSIVLAGTNIESIRRATALVLDQWDSGVRTSTPEEYQVLDCSVRVSRLIIGLSGVHRDWTGLRSEPWAMIR
ncbi:MAG: UDP-N-acetylglucosamine 2-epimerase (non-hydrolyzing) [Pseudonocardiales bacterium]|nr:MAG: UDP-N-acetylglucosamine 2-epimerase (non-hydrolyzing) [Pseudonocardiales bacterium]